MDFNQLQASWKERDQRIEQSLKINTALLRLNLVEQHRREVNKLSVLDWLEIIVGVPFCTLLIWFISKHSHAWEFAVPAYSLLVWSVVLPTLNHIQRHRLHNLDYSQPIIQIQMALSKLKTARLRLFLWAFLIGQIVWFIPFLIVFLKGVFGINLYLASENFIVPCLIGGVLFIPLSLSLGKIIAPHLRTSGYFQSITNMLAGKDLKNSQLFLEKLAKFNSFDSDT